MSNTVLVEVPVPPRVESWEGVPTIEFRRHHTVAVVVVVVVLGVALYPLVQFPVSTRTTFSLCCDKNNSPPTLATDAIANDDVVHFCFVGNREQSQWVGSR